MSRIVWLFASLCVAVCAVSKASAEEKPAYTRFIGPKTMMFIQYRWSELLEIPAVQTLVANMPGGREQMEKDFHKGLGINVADVETITMYLDEPVFVDGRPLPPRTTIFVTTRKKMDIEALRRTAGASPNTIKHGKYDLTVGGKVGLVCIDDRSVLVFLDVQGRTAEELREDQLLQLDRMEGSVETPQRWKQTVALASNQKSLLFIGFQFPDELRKLAEVSLKEAPPVVAPFKSLMKMETASLAMNYAASQETDCEFTISLRFPNARSAQAGLGAVKFGIASGKMAMNSMPKQEAPRNLENYWLYAAGFARRQIDLIQTNQNDNDVVINYAMKSKEFLPLLQLTIEKVRYAANKMLSASNMRQLMIAMHNFHSDHSHLPEVMTVKDGKPLHSWRIHILPYIEQDGLYKQLRLDEPWDSEHNKKVFESNPMPKVFEHPHLIKDGERKLTYYQVFYSKAGAKKPAGLRLGAKTTLGQIVVRDGASNTAAMIEHSKPVPWYKPEDVEFDGAGPFPKLTSVWHANRAQVAFFDGSVRSFFLGKDEDTWKAMVTWDGGEVIDFSKIED